MTEQEKKIEEKDALIKLLEEQLSNILEEPDNQYQVESHVEYAQKMITEHYIQEYRRNKKDLDPVLKNAAGPEFPEETKARLMMIRKEMMKAKNGK